VSRVRGPERPLPMEPMVLLLMARVIERFRDLANTHQPPPLQSVFNSSGLDRRRELEIDSSALSVDTADEADELRVRANRVTARQVRVQRDGSARSDNRLVVTRLRSISPRTPARSVHKKAACSCLDPTSLPQHSPCTSHIGTSGQHLALE
jgi:hypothetical protein